MSLPIREISKQEWLETGNYFGIPIAKLITKARLNLVLTIPPILSFLLVFKYWQGGTIPLRLFIVLFEVLIVYMIKLAFDLRGLYSPVITEVKEISYDTLNSEYIVLQSTFDKTVNTEVENKCETLLKMAIATFITNKDNERACIVNGVLTASSLSNFNNLDSNSHVFLELYKSKYKSTVLTFKVYIQKNESEQLELLYEV